MNNNLMISGFSDEISSDFNKQLSVVSKLGIKYISLRGIDEISIGDYTLDETKKESCQGFKNQELVFLQLDLPLEKCSLMMKMVFLNKRLY